MSLLEARKQYKPFEYPWAFDFWKRQQQIHWLPEEVPLSEDCRDWAHKLSEHERNLLTQIFRFFTQADVEVQDCFIEGTDILTPRGFVPFHKLRENDLVAQVHPDTMRIEFVKTEQRVHRRHTGKMVKFSNDSGHVSALVTPNHEMFYERVGTIDAGARYKETADELGMTQYKAFHTAALAPWEPSSSRVEINTSLTAEERLLIAYQADGNKNQDSRQMIFGFKKERKIERMRALLDSSEYRYTERPYEHPQWGSYTYFTVEYNQSKPDAFEWVDLSSVNQTWCQEFLEELSYWDSWRSETGHLQYRSTNHEAASMVEAIRVLAGYKGKSVNCNYPGQSPHTLVTYTSDYKPVRLAKVRKEYIDVIDADVYCVTVPTGVIVTRYQGSTLVAGNCYHEKYGRVFKPTEIKMMLAAFSNMETVHIAAYSHLLDTIGMPESEYSAFLQYAAMKDKHDYMQNFGVDNDEDIARTLAMFGGFTEGVQLFASFAMLMNFPRHNKMKGMGQIVTWSIRDESLHCEGIIKMFHTFCQERQCLTKAVKDDIMDVCQTTINLEDNFIDLAFEMGPVEGMTAPEIKRYTRYIADWRLEQLGLPKIYKIGEHPLLWLAPLLNGQEHANIFEQRATEYSKVATKGEWNSVWEDYDRRQHSLLTSDRLLA